MIRINLAANGTIALALTLSACGAPSGNAPADEASPVATATPTAPPEAEPTPTHTPNTVGPAPGDADNDGYPDLTPAPLTPEAERTVKGARNVLLSFARAIELHEWDQAWNLLSPGDKAKWTKPKWAAMFADLDKITVAIPNGTMEGAAGSSYYTGPVTITGNDRDGRPVAYTGEAVLRRVNDVDGATPEQLRWHFDHLTLDWTH